MFMSKKFILLIPLLQFTQIKMLLAVFNENRKVIGV